jgi:hypothetical protein
VAATVIRLSAEDIAAIEQAMPLEAIVGDRYDQIGRSLIEQ